MLSIFRKFVPKIGMKPLNSFISFRTFAVSPHMKDLADYNLEDVPVDK